MDNKAKPHAVSRKTEVARVTRKAIRISTRPRLDPGTRGVGLIHVPVAASTLKRAIEFQVWFLVVG